MPFKFESDIDKQHEIMLSRNIKNLNKKDTTNTISNNNQSTYYSISKNDTQFEIDVPINNEKIAIDKKTDFMYRTA